MNIIFMGTPLFAVPTLNALVEAGHNIICVVAQPDKPVGRGKKMQSPPTVVRARELGIETKQPRAVKRGPFPTWMLGANADLAVVVAYGRILTPTLLKAPKRGCINVHASVLPQYRGAAPIQWAIINGEKETGVTTMQMDEGLDTGDVLLEQRTPIQPNETTAQLSERLMQMGAKLAVETIAQLDQISPRPQDHPLATHAPLLTKATGRIQWNLPAEEIHNLVRGLNPWPIAHTTFRGQPLKIHETNIVIGDENTAPPGTITQTKKHLLVSTGTVSLDLVKVQMAGKKAQPGGVFTNGARVQIGEPLE